MRLRTGLFLASLVALVGCGPQKKPVGASGAPVSAEDVAVIVTTEGEMVFRLRPDKAKGTVENFITLARTGFYEGTAFHRIIQGFMIQGGDPHTKDAGNRALWGMGGPGYTIKDEFSDLKHERGVISMAHSAAADSAGSQFFICDGSVPRLDGKYAAFGRLVKGEAVLAKIAETPVQPSRTGELSEPQKRVGILAVHIRPADKGE